ncbi:uncharacterized protein EV422DRAFT_572304 [Fimicolochytrium jonesii]|uniref:uncharacterized protein n=1 Tax=Fimicolochytrium jonesii TaxID=1396493 RepID=UPI0022FE2505|nr:uncharacterized protein EV422DRAFT_572304 [Fimicolochytrium jonesii]KAI8815963.1 hypothetical protein EV422DRAFT_572304 [Fimicolochytrium jonesii]
MPPTKKQQRRFSPYSTPLQKRRASVHDEPGPVRSQSFVQPPQNAQNSTEWATLPEVDTGAPAVRLQKLNDALELNRALQEQLREQLRDITRRKRENEDAQKKVEPLIEPERPPYPTRHFSIDFEDARDGSVPPDNYDVQIEKLLFGRCIKAEIIYRKGRWKPTEHEALVKAIDFYNKKLRYNRQTGEIDPGLESTSEEFIQLLDWEAVSGLVGERTAAECKREWILNRGQLARGPVGSRKDFTTKDMKRLRQAVATYGGRSWDLTAEYVGNDATPIQCFREYQIKLTKDVKNRPWTDEEGVILRRAVRKWGTRWSRVAEEVPVRTAAECRHHHGKMVTDEKARVKIGKFTEREDDFLIEHVKHHGRSLGLWTTAAAILKRTPAACRDRYERTLTIRDWQKETFQKLRQLAMEDPDAQPWAKWARELGSADHMVRHYYHMLKKRGYFKPRPDKEALQYVQLKLRHPPQKEKAAKRAMEEATSMAVREATRVAVMKKKGDKKGGQEDGEGGEDDEGEEAQG